MPWIGDESHRELILQNVVATHEAITQANGFELDVQTVTRIVRDIEDSIVNEVAAAETPMHQLVSGIEELSPAGTGQLVRGTFTIVDWLIVKVDELERALRDAKVAMWADRRRGTHPSSGARLALDTRLLTIETAEQIFYPYELARIEWAIDYTHLEGAP